MKTILVLSALLLTGCSTFQYHSVVETVPVESLSIEGKFHLTQACWENVESACLHLKTLLDTNPNLYLMLNQREYDRRIASSNQTVNILQALSDTWSR